MRTFHCDHCGNPVFYENVFCAKCGHTLAFIPDVMLVASLDEVPPGNTPAKEVVAPSAAPPAPPDKPQKLPLWVSPVPRAKGKTYRLCRNYTEHAVCNWAISSNDKNDYCRSCRLTPVIPDLSVAENHALWLRLEIAKRRLLYSLLEYELPVHDRIEDPRLGLAFHFKGDPPGGPRVLTGHDHGLITVNIGEADDVQRERNRVSLHEPYRTLLGHFRHEIGHYYWDLLLQNSPRIEDYRKLFGDERANYDQALKDHYAKGPKPGWQESFVSEYASVHPWEDWAETWAHYLHMTDTLETAASCGLSLQPDRSDEPTLKKQVKKPAHRQNFDEIIDNWFPLTYALNNLNRGMGLSDAYPFILSPKAIEKLKFVHQTVCQASRAD
jgi:hypothetical protein